MEIYEKINLLIKEKKLNKKQFAISLISLEPKLKSTGEIPTIKAIYSYLSGDVALKLELIPYIAEVLEIPEQLLFDDTLRTRKRYLKHILNSISSEETQLLQNALCEKKSTLNATPKDVHYKIHDLLIYAPEMFLKELESTLTQYKELTIKFRK